MSKNKSNEFYHLVENKLSLIIDLYDSSKYEGNKHYYNHQNKLTVENKLSPL